jgi:hypothetical protein
MKQAKRQLAGSGETPPAIPIGEVIELTSTSDLRLSTIAGTDTDVITGLTLTRGVWELEAWATIDLSGAIGLRGNGRVARIRITDNSNTEIRSVLTGFASAENPFSTAFGSVKVRINISASTTYKLRAGTIERVRGNLTTISSVTVRSSAGSPAVLRAVCIAHNQRDE